MLLRNGKNFLAVRNSGNVNFQIKDYTGDTQNEYLPNAAYSSIHVGSNNTAPTTSDYSITTVSGLTLVNNSASYNNGTSWGADYLASFSSTYKNNTNQDIEVNEYGVCYYDTYRDGFWHYYFTRDVLDEPKVIHPGESYTFSVTMG